MGAVDQRGEAAQFSIQTIAAYQAAGIFFLLFYYSDLLLITLNAQFPGYPLSEYINAFVLSIYHLSNGAQKFLSDYFPFLLLASVYMIATIYLVIALFSVAKGTPGAWFRAALFFALGLSAIPFVLLIWTLRWVPAYVLAIIRSIIGFFGAIFAFLGGLIATFIGWVWPLISVLFVIGVGLVGIYFAYIITMYALRSSRIILIITTIISAIVVCLIFWKYLHILFDTMAYFQTIVTGGVIFIWRGIGFVIGFLVSVAVIVGIAAFVLIVSMFVTSQFGHILLDTLLDARNVSRSARTAGRFLAGIGFVVSTVILCFPENAVARQGAIMAAQEVLQPFGHTLSVIPATGVVDSIAHAYLLLVPDSVQASVTKAFSFGYPPSLELTLLVLSCTIALVLITRQLFRREAGGKLSVAFYPRELFFLLVGAALVLMVVFAAGGDGE